MYEVHHSVDDLEPGNQILWNGHEYTVTDISDGVIELNDEHMLETETAERWFTSEDVPFEVVL